MTNCKHEKFNAQVNVNRIEDINKYIAEISITCAQCGVDFSFIGLPRGTNVNEPMAGAYGLEAKLPIKPLVEGDKTPETMRILVPGQ